MKRERMKIKVFCIAFVLVLALGGLVVLPSQEAKTAGSSFSGGDGSAVNPYLIENVDDLQAMNNDRSAYYALNNSIDLTGFNWSNWGDGAGFLPIGNQTHPFTGNLDGRGHTITGLYINRPTTDYVGLFGYITGNTISNMTILNVAVTGSNNVGGLAGFNTGPISNSSVSGTVSGNENVGGLMGYNSNHGTVTCSYATGTVIGIYYVGGLVGRNNGAASNSYATGRVSGNNSVSGLVGENYGAVSNSYATGSVSGNNSVGGLMGENYGTVSDSYATGSISGSYQVGGLVGYNWEGAASKSYATGRVSGNNSVGGLVGRNWEGSITNCYAKGTVSGTNYGGGLVGSNEGSTVSNSYATGNVEGNWYVGGLMGYNSNHGTVTGSYATGTVSGTGYGGGLVGYNWDSTASNSYATGRVSGNNNVGGLVGYNWNGTVTNSYAAGAVSGDYGGGLVGLNYYGTVTNSYATGRVSGNNSVGGLVGSNTGTVTDSFWDTQTSNQPISDGGKGKTTSEMKTIATFAAANWDIQGNETNLNDGYPYLSGQLPGNSPVWYISPKPTSTPTPTVKPPATSCPNPGVPTSPSPANVSSPRVPLNTSVLDWSDCSNASYYDVYWDTNASSLFYATSNNSNVSLPTLSSNTTYYWKIVARNDCGNYSNSSIWHFTTECAVPITPLNPSPENGSTCIPLNTSLGFSSLSSNNTADYYQFYLGKNSSALQLVGNFNFSQVLSSGGCNIANLSYNTTYYWKVVANNSCGTNNSSAIWRFTTLGYPATPTTPYPSNGSTGVPVNVTLDWKDCANAVSYYVCYGTSSDLSNGICAYTNNSSYQLPDLPYATTFFWRVMSVNNCNSNTSEIWSFTTHEPSMINIGGTNTSWNISKGIVQQVVNISSADNTIRVKILAGTKVLGHDGQPLDSIDLMASDVYPLPDGNRRVLAAFDCGPNGATFNPGIQITVKYDPSKIPSGMNESKLVVAFYNGTAAKWEYLSGIVNAGADTITFTTTHFTIFTVQTPPIEQKSAWLAIILIIFFAAAVLGVVGFLYMKYKRNAGRKTHSKEQEGSDKNTGNNNKPNRLQLSPRKTVFAKVFQRPPKSTNKKTLQPRVTRSEVTHKQWKPSLLTISVVAIVIIIIIVIVCMAYSVVALMHQGTSISISPTYIGMAVASLVLGVLGISLLAIVFRVLGMEHAKKPGAKGYGMTVAGFALGIIWAIVSVVGIVLTIMS